MSAAQFGPMLQRMPHTPTLTPERRPVRPLGSRFVAEARTEARDQFVLNFSRDRCRSRARFLRGRQLGASPEGGRGIEACREATAKTGSWSTRSARRPVRSFRGSLVWTPSIWLGSRKSPLTDRTKAAIERRRSRECPTTEGLIIAVISGQPPLPKGKAGLALTTSA